MANAADFTSHNTPPPFLIAAGSLIVERKNQYLPGDIKVNAATNRKAHHLNPDPGKNRIFPGHIKVVDGSGEILYRNDRAENCAISLQVREDPSGNMISVTASPSPVVAGKQTFFIETEAAKILDDTKEKPSTKRDVRYKLKDGTNTFTIVDLKIAEGSNVQYAVHLPDLADSGNELKIMVWLEQS